MEQSDVGLVNIGPLPRSQLERYVLCGTATHRQGSVRGTEFEQQTVQDRVEYIKVMPRHPSRRESFLQELTLELIAQGRYAEALSELEL